MMMGDVISLENGDSSSGEPVTDGGRLGGLIIAII
jgi:hypothetical protein